MDVADATDWLQDKFLPFVVDAGSGTLEQGYQLRAGEVHVVGEVDEFCSYDGLGGVYESGLPGDRKDLDAGEFHGFHAVGVGEVWVCGHIGTIKRADQRAFLGV